MLMAKRSRLKIMTVRNRRCSNCCIDLLLGLRPVHKIENNCQEIWFCVRCKYEEFGDFREDTIHFEDELSLIIEWKLGMPTVEEIGAVRTIDPNLKYRSLLIVIAELKTSPNWKIEGLRKDKLSELCQLSEQFGLKYRIEI
jgi:hypothetical protein